MMKSIYSRIKSISLKRFMLALIVAVCAGLGWQSCQRVDAPPTASTFAKTQNDHILRYLDSLGIENTRIKQAGTRTYPAYVVIDTAKPGALSLLNGMTVMTRYSGHVLDSAYIFDENYSKPEPFRFDLGTSDVITGWNESLLLFRIGESGRIFIPSALGYGTQAQPRIPANSILVFNIRVANAQ